MKSEQQSYLEYLYKSYELSHIFTHLKYPSDNAHHEKAKYERKHKHTKIKEHLIIYLFTT